MRSSRIAFRRAAAPYDSIDSLPAPLPDTSRRPGPDPGAAVNAATAPWTPALELALLATCALHALLSRRAAAPCDPIDSLPAQQPDTLRRPGPDPGAAINAVNCTLDASPGNRTACHLRSSRTAFRRAAAPRDSTNSTRPFPLHHESPALVARP